MLRDDIKRMTWQKVQSSNFKYLHLQVKKASTLFYNQRNRKHEGNQSEANFKSENTMPFGMGNNLEIKSYELCNSLILIIFYRWYTLALSITYCKHQKWWYLWACLESCEMLSKVVNFIMWACGITAESPSLEAGFQTTSAASRGWRGTV